MSNSLVSPCTDEKFLNVRHTRVDADGFWAVLIGIDGYSSSPLCSCIADVEKMKDFLTVDLGVPEDHIQCLVSTQTLPKPISTASHLAGNLAATWNVGQGATGIAARYTGR